MGQLQCQQPAIGQRQQQRQLRLLRLPICISPPTSVPLLAIRSSRAGTRLTRSPSYHDPEVEIEPVDPRPFLDFEREATIRLDQPQRKIVGDIDQPALGPQLRNIAQHELDPGCRVRIHERQVAGVRVGLRQGMVVVDLGEAEPACPFGGLILGHGIADDLIQHATMLHDAVRLPVQAARDADRPVAPR